MITALYLFVLMIIITMLIIVELGILPGLSISGIFAILITGFSIYYAYTSYGVWGAVITLVIYGISIPIIVNLILKRAQHLFPKLNTSIDSTVDPLSDISVEVGDEGVVESRMAPVGYIIVNEQRFQSYSVEGVIDKNQKVVVVKIENKKVYVSPI
ncbi:NfeD family protein [Halosquirtibacter laminarini]|uniref:NfeD family protein n=1 Tax=Halosquirtibacter laminarini TaxID=3374600 RepID=A0AC61NGX2_9BACT|nr:NfeD family protein [Prolixibacteraceae bacterium]